MARIRSIHPGLFTDEAFVALSPLARVLLLGIWTEADDHGVFDWKPLTLKMRILPLDNTDIEALLAELQAVQVIARVTLAGKDHGLVRNFCRFQRPKKPTYRVALPNEYWNYIGLKPDGSVPNHQSALTPPPPVPNTSPTASPPVENQPGNPSSEGGGRREKKGKEEDSTTKTSVVVVVPPKVSTKTTTKASNQVGMKDEVGTPLPSDWKPDDAGIWFAHDQGMTDAAIDEQIISFSAYNYGQGSVCPDWGAFWTRWCIKWKERQAPKAPPRIEVNTTPDWDAHAKMWSTIGRWPSHGAGGEPGMKSCRCPPDVLLRHSIDPNTGLKIKERA